MSDIEQDWWTLEELSRRWRISVATLRRRCDLPPDHAQHIRAMIAGTAKRRVHISEIVRHEAAAKAQQAGEIEIIHKPVVFRPSSRFARKRAEIRARHQRKEKSVVG